MAEIINLFTKEKTTVEDIVSVITDPKSTQAEFLDICRKTLDNNDYLDLLESICCFEKYMYADEYIKNLTSMYLGLQSTVG